MEAASRFPFLNVRFIANKPPEPLLSPSAPVNVLGELRRRIVESLSLAVIVSLFVAVFLCSCHARERFTLLAVLAQRLQWPPRMPLRDSRSDSSARWMKRVTGKEWTVDIVSLLRVERTRKTLIVKPYPRRFSEFRGGRVQRIYSYLITTSGVRFFTTAVVSRRLFSSLARARFTTTV